MIVVIRIAGQCKMKSDIKETFNRLKMGTKYSCILVDEADLVRMGMVKKVITSVMVGKIDDAMIKKLKDNRDKGKPVYFLHPPRGGFKRSTKMVHPKGILGENPDTVKYLEKML